MKIHQTESVDQTKADSLAIPLLEPGTSNVVIVPLPEADRCMVYFKNPATGQAVAKVSWDPRGGCRGKKYFAPQPADLVMRYLTNWQPSPEPTT